MRSLACSYTLPNSDGTFGGGPAETGEQQKVMKGKFMDTSRTIRREMPGSTQYSSAVCFQGLIRMALKPQPRTSLPRAGCDCM